MCRIQPHTTDTTFFLRAPKHSTYDIEITSEAVLWGVWKGRLCKGLAISQPRQKGLGGVTPLSQPLGVCQRGSKYGLSYWETGKPLVHVCLAMRGKDETCFFTPLPWTLQINSTAKIPMPPPTQMWVWGEKLRLWSRERKVQKVFSRQMHNMQMLESVRRKVKGTWGTILGKKRSRRRGGYFSLGR